MKMSKKFDQFMAAEYTVVFALALSAICAVATDALGMQEFRLSYWIFETVFAMAIAWLCVSVLPVFPIGNALAVNIFKKEPPSRGYMLFMSAGICSLLIPCICMCMCSLIVGYPNGLNFTIIWNGFKMFAAPMYICSIILVQILGKPLFKIAIKFLGDEAFEKPEVDETAEAAAVEEPEEEKDLSVEVGGDMHGDWDVVNVSPVGKNKLMFHMEQRGEKLYGSLDYTGKTAKIRKGSYKDGKFEFTVTLVMPFGAREVVMSGTIADGVLKGTSLMDGRETPLNGNKL